MDKLLSPLPKERAPSELGDGERKAINNASAATLCNCGICSRKMDGTTVCEHHLNTPQSSVLQLNMDDRFLDVPTNISQASSLRHWGSSFPDESSVDVAVTVLPIEQPRMDPDVSFFIPPPQSTLTSTSSIRDISQPVNMPNSTSSSLQSSRVFAHILNTQSTISLPVSFEAFITPRPAPSPPEGSTTASLPPNIVLNNMSMTFVPGLPIIVRRSEDTKEQFPCQICLEDESYDDAVVVQACGHMFGKECMKSYIISKLDERRFPIPCPCCTVEEGSAQALITSGIAMQVNLSDVDCARWDELEFIAHAIRFDCGKCGESNVVDRHHLVKEKKKHKKLRCTTPNCSGAWCRECRSVVEPGASHKCVGRKELKRLMKREGWKNCPGCNIPVQKSSGCNHIACSAPGCNTHFCYRCGDILVRSVFGSEIHNAISTHFRRKIYFWRCAQFQDSWWHAIVTRIRGNGRT